MFHLTWMSMQRYLRWNADPAKNWSPWAQAVLDPATAKKASGAAEGLCKHAFRQRAWFGSSSPAVVYKQYKWSSVARSQF